MKHVYIIDIVTKSGLYFQRKVFASKLDAYEFGTLKELDGYEFVIKREKINKRDSR